MLALAASLTVPSADDLVIIPQVTAPKPLNFSAPFDWRDKHLVCEPQTPERTEWVYVYENLRCHVIGDAT